MAQISIINLKEIKRSRLDSERYLPKYEVLENNLLNSFGKKLSSLIIKPVRTGHTPKERFLKDDDDKLIFIKTDTLRDFFINFENADILPQKSVTKNSFLKDGEILVTIIGAHFNIIGRAAIYLKEYPACVVNQNVAVISLNKDKIDPMYFSVFLNSKIGREQLWMLSRQTEQVNLNCREIEELLVIVPPMEFQKEIARLFTTSNDLLKQSYTQYATAEKMLLNDLNIKKESYIQKLTYISECSNVHKNKRMDAEFYQPKYDEIIKIASQKTILRKLGDLVKISKGVEVGSEEYNEEGIPFIRVSNLNKYEMNDNNQKYISNELFDTLKNKFKPKKGEILLSKDATPGLAFLIEDEKDMIISGGLLRLKVDSDTDKNYLTMVLNSLFVQSQIERDAGGSIIVHWRPELIKETLIPILPKVKQEEISKLVEESHKSRIKAKQLLEEAKRKVEELIKKQAK